MARQDCPFPSSPVKRTRGKACSGRRRAAQCVRPRGALDMAGKILTIAQQKGGVGKTTLAIHLSVAWMVGGRRVALLDIDPQASLSMWHQLRRAQLGTAGVEPHLSSLAGWRVANEAERLARDYDVVLIDSPPHAETEARLAVRAAARVVIPVQPSILDLWATRATLELAKAE